MKNPNLIRLFNDVLHHGTEEQLIFVAKELGASSNSYNELVKFKNQALKIMLSEDEGRVMYYTYTIHNNEETLFSIYIEKGDKTGFFKFHTKDYSVLDGVEYRGSEGVSTSCSKQHKKQVKYLDFIQNFKKEFNL